MNKLIREIAEQAGYTPLSPPTFGDELNEIFMQNLAELIVMEVFSAIEDEGFEVYGPVVQRVKQRFGVKE
jgi:hypothetical protein